MPDHRRRSRYPSTATAIVVVAVPLLLTSLLMPSPQGAWSGQTDVKVVVDSADDLNIAALECRAYWFDAQAAEAASELARWQPSDWDEVSSMRWDGAPIIMSVRTSGRYQCGRKTHHQQKHAVVAALLTDGRTVVKIEQIPDTQLSREMRVTF